MSGEELSGEVQESEVEESWRRRVSVRPSIRPYFPPYARSSVFEQITSFEGRLGEA